MKKIFLLIAGLATIFSNYSHANPDAKSVVLLDQLLKLDEKELEQLKLDYSKLEMLAKKALGIDVRLYDSKIGKKEGKIYSLKSENGNEETYGLVRKLNNKQGLYAYGYRPEYSFKSQSSIYCMLQQIGALRNLNSETIEKIKALNEFLYINALSISFDDKYSYERYSEFVDALRLKSPNLNGPRYYALFTNEVYSSNFWGKEERPVDTIEVDQRINPNRDIEDRYARLEIRFPAVASNKCNILKDNLNHEFQRVIPEVAKEMAIDRENARKHVEKAEAERRRSAELYDLKMQLESEASSSKSAK